MAGVAGLARRARRSGRRWRGSAPPSSCCRRSMGPRRRASGRGRRVERRYTGSWYCAGEAFAAGGLEGTLAGVWVAVREVATGAMIPAQQPAKIVLVGPRPDAGPLASAARAALENLARTLSVEWARYSLTTVAVAPGEGTTDEELASVVGYLVSVAGDYFSGTQLELGAVARG